MTLCIFLGVGDGYDEARELRDMLAEFDRPENSTIPATNTRNKKLR